MGRVVIADDHPIMLSGIEAILRSTPYQVIATVHSGLDVIPAVLTAEPDILILDVNLPERSGIDILRDLRQIGIDLRIVLLTAAINDDDLLEALDLAVDGILSKDGGQQTLILCLDEVSTGRRWIDRPLAIRIAGARAAKERDPLQFLTQRELAMAKLVAEGLRNRSIAAELGVTEGTVKVYLNRVYEKLGISSRTELALYVKKVR